MSWFIERLVDLGPKERYRYHVSGLNTEPRIPERFSWSVPSLDDERYLTHPDASAELRALVDVAKKKVTP